MTALSKKQPYPGLRPFDDGDEAFFFGRDAQKQGLREKLRTSRLVAVVGRSGCGKSSLVKAGLVPLLRGEVDDDKRPIWHIASYSSRRASGTSEVREASRRPRYCSSMSAL